MVTGRITPAGDSTRAGCVLGYSVFEFKLANDLRREPLAFWKRWCVKGMPCGLDDCDAFLEHFQCLFHAEQNARENAVHLNEAPFHDTSRVIDVEMHDVNEDVVNRAQRRNTFVGDLVGSRTRLCEPFSLEELIRVLKKMHNDRATSDGYRCELYKYAKVKEQESHGYTFILGDSLLRIFNKVFLEDSGIPDSWHEVIVVPVFKGKGSTEDPDNYRGISLLTTYYKIYASLLEQRLYEFCDIMNVRAYTQVGFRKHHGATTALFTLRHAIHASCSPSRQGGHQKPLFVCFVDYKKAFDSVIRSLIWQRLREIGVHGHMYHAITGLYTDTRFRIRVNGKTSEGYVVTVAGVKQGCPLSPLLFGLFIEQLHTYLQEKCPDIGVQILPEEKLSDALYADDAALLANSNTDLQRLCDCLARWSDEHGMELNYEKTEVVCFTPHIGTIDEAHIIIGGHSLKVVEEFKYLGIPVHNRKGYANACVFTTGKAIKAMWALLSRIEALQITCLATKVSLFRILVESVANYGCQVWGADMLRIDSEQHILGNAVQKMVLYFLRIISGAHSTVSRWVLLREFDMYPIQMRWACLCARYWNRSLSPPHAVLARASLVADVQLFTRGHDSCWTAKFLRLMCQLDLVRGIPYSALKNCSLNEILGLRFGEDMIQEAMVKAYDRVFDAHGDDPRIAPSRHLMITRQRAWFYSPLYRHLHFVAPTHYIKTLIQFRVGAILLQVHNGRRERTPRGYRFCHVCSGQQVEDEVHFIFECRAYTRYRRHRNWNSLFCMRDKDMKSFMEQEEQYKLSHYLVMALRYRSHMLHRLNHADNRVEGSYRNNDASIYLDAFDSEED